MRIKAKSTIRHGGVEYVEGDVFEVDTKSGERLLKLEVAVTTGESLKGGDYIDRLNPMAEPPADLSAPSASVAPSAPAGGKKA